MDVAFGNNGTKMYVIGWNSLQIHQYSLSTAWDVTTSTFEKSFDISTYDTRPNGIFFKPDGTKMYLTGWTYENIFQYTLTTAWDISSSSHDATVNVEAQDNGATDL